jgi:hypothetical protein
LRSTSAASPNSAGRPAGADAATSAASPQALREARGALHPALGPFDIALGRRIRQHEPARHVGAVAAHDVVWVDGVLLRLRHLFDRADDQFFASFSQPGFTRSRASLNSGRCILNCSLDCHLGFDLCRRHPLAISPAIGFVHHHALREQAGERLVEAGVAGRLHGAGEEAAVEQMQNRVLDAADILVDR